MTLFPGIYPEIRYVPGNPSKYRDIRKSGVSKGKSWEMVFITYLMHFNYLETSYLV